MVLPFVLLVIVAFSGLVTTLAGNLVRQSGDVFLLRTQIQARQDAVVELRVVRAGIESGPMNAVDRAEPLPEAPEAGNLYRSDRVCDARNAFPEGDRPVCSQWLHWFFTRWWNAEFRPFSAEARWRIEWETGPLGDPVGVRVVRQQWRYHL